LSRRGIKRSSQLHSKEQGVQQRGGIDKSEWGGGQWVEREFKRDKVHRKRRKLGIYCKEH